MPAAYAVAVTNLRLKLKTSGRPATRKGDDDPIEHGTLGLDEPIGRFVRLYLLMVKPRERLDTRTG
jgi:hypothetical protein